jgi:hypothetical protein
MGSHGCHPNPREPGATLAIASGVRNVRFSRFGAVESGALNALTSLVSLHLAGEVDEHLTLNTLPSQFTRTSTDAALTSYGGSVAWSDFLNAVPTASPETP